MIIDYSFEEFLLLIFSLLLLSLLLLLNLKFSVFNPLLCCLSVSSLSFLVLNLMRNTSFTLKKRNMRKNGKSSVKMICFFSFSFAWFSYYYYYMWLLCMQTYNTNKWEKSKQIFPILHFFQRSTACLLSFFSINLFCTYGKYYYTKYKLS